MKETKVKERIMSKLDDIINQMVEAVDEKLKEEHPWRAHVKKHAAAHPKGSIGKMDDAETKEFFKKAKSSFGKGHSDEEIKAMHNGPKKESLSEKEIEDSVIVIYEQIQRYNLMSDHQYHAEINELRDDLMRLGHNEAMAKRVMNNRCITEQVTDPSKIKVEHPGVLEVPKGKDVDKLPISHFVNLAKKKGRGDVVRALMNLYRWNKGKGGDRGKLANWAKKTQEVVSKSMEKAGK